MSHNQELSHSLITLYPINHSETLRSIILEDTEEIEYLHEGQSLDLCSHMK